MMSISFFGSPFDLDNQLSYMEWRKRKLSRMPVTVNDLVVEVTDLANPSAAEIGALTDRVRRCNMAVFQTTAPSRHKSELMALGTAMGLNRLDANALADEDGITPLAVHREGVRSRYVPYTERPIAWHTDGYYNPTNRLIGGLMLFCVRPAGQGGANRLMDHEALYISLRDEDPTHIAALMRPDAMTIPGNDEEGLQRPATVGPVFFVDKMGHLCMRYTARTRNVEWSTEPEVQNAAAAIKRLLDQPSPYSFNHTLSAGQGLVCNNVLHTREKFQDDSTSPRLLYRARYIDRISGT